MFTTLRPCDYRLEVTDRVTSLSDSVSFAIGANDDPLAVTAIFAGCEALIIATGGAGPYTVEYTIAGGVLRSAETGDTVRAGPLGDSVLEGAVRDVCGNSRSFTVNGAATAPSRVRSAQSDTTVQILATRGAGPFTYELSSTAGTFTNTTGTFTYAQIGCEPVVSITGACNNAPVVERIELRSRVNIGCVNFTDGTVEVVVSPPGATPYSFEVTVGDSTFTTSDNVITGIPTGARFVSITAQDACGRNLPGVAEVTPLRLITPTEAGSCDDVTLPFRIGRTCGGSLSLPLTLACTTCPGQSPLTLEEAEQELLITNGVAPGGYTIALEDGCGEQLICQDTVFLEAIPACDSIIATYVQRFECSNETESRRAIRDPAFRYTLEDAMGNVLETDNRSGRFANLATGRYRIVQTGGCDTVEAIVDLGASRDIDPEITVRPTYEDERGVESCQLRYLLEVGRSEGPYQLEGLDDTGVRLQLNDFGLTDCPTLAVPIRLLPGRYRLASLARCGEVEFTLPDLMEPRIDTVSVLSVCPDNASLQIEGLMRSDANWRAYFADLGLSLRIGSRDDDYYLVNGRRTNSARPGGVAPGPARVDVVFGFAPPSCPVDSFTLDIPEYEPVALGVTGNFLCNATGEAPLRLRPDFGAPPYRLRRLACDDPGRVLADTVLEAGADIVLPVTELGVYCFVVEDGCGITSDFQTQVRDLSDRLLFAYDCEESLTLLTDPFPGRFTWFGPQGELVGEGPEITLPASLEDRTFTLEVVTEYCVLSGELPVPGRSVRPVLQLSPAGEVVQCGTDSVAILLRTDTSSFVVWNDSMLVETERVNAGGGARDARLVFGEQGKVVFTATNDLGCHVTDSVTIRRSPKPDPEIEVVRRCPGEDVVLAITGSSADRIRWNVAGRTDTFLTVRDAGRYTVSATSLDGCIGVDSIDITLPAAFELSVLTDSVSCFGAADGALAVVASGGTGELRFSIDSTQRSLEEMLTNLGAGAYTVTLADENGCAIDTTVQIDQPDSLRLSIGPDRTAELGQRITVDLATNVNDITDLQLSRPLADTLLEDRRLSFSASTGGRVRIVLTDERGCTVADAFRLAVATPGLYVPTAFSPNGDGVNDRFLPYTGNPEVVRVSIHIYDRWGNLHFAANELAPNEERLGWDGRSGNGDPMPTGTYIWRSTVRFLGGEQRALAGAVTLVR